jgi:uncharacterized protein with ParB-like and HNH nuclease domain
MKAEDIRLTQLLEGPKQFIVPVFQRDYSWGTKHCLQLWKDVARVGSDDTAKAHFVGSVVYIAAEDIKAPLARWLLIDGQQRLRIRAKITCPLGGVISAGGFHSSIRRETDAA